MDLYAVSLMLTKVSRRCCGRTRKSLGGRRSNFSCVGNPSRVTSRIADVVNKVALGLRTACEDDDVVLVGLLAAE